MTTEALAQGFTRMLTDAVFAAEVGRGPDTALGYLDLDDHEKQLLADAGREGVDDMGEGHGGAMKRVAEEMSRHQTAITPTTQATLSAAVQQKMMEQLARADILDKAFEPEEENN